MQNQYHGSRFKSLSVAEQYILGDFLKIRVLLGMKNGSEGYRKVNLSRGMKQVVLNF